MNYYASQGITTALAYIYLTDYYNTSIPQSKLNAIQTTFSYFRNNGYKVLPLFLYEFSTLPTFGPTKAMILTHLNQLAPILAANSDIFAAMPTGFVGAYGEWHSSYYHLEEDQQSLTEIAAKILEVLPNDRMICIRVPKYKRWVLGQPNLADYALLGNADAFNLTNKARIGFSDDGFMASDAGIMNDGYTWTEPPYYASTGNPEFDMMSVESAYLFVNGEMFIQDYGGVIDGYAAAKRMRLHHYSTFSYFHGNNELELYGGDLNPPAYNINRWKQTNISKSNLIANKMPMSNGYFEDSSGNSVNRTQFEYIRDHLGYRIEIQEANIPDELVWGDSLSLQIKLINRGFAAIMNPRPVIVTLIRWDGTVYEFLTNANPQLWQPFSPGDQTYTPLVHTISIQADLPADIKPGIYSVGLWMPDAHEGLHLNSKYSIRLANGNVAWWTDSQSRYGINVIGQVEIAGSNKLLAYWKLDETTGTAASDSSNNGNQAVLKGSLNFDTKSVQGKSGNALNFNYSTRDYISAGTGPSLGGTTDFTVTAWIKTSVYWPVAIVQQRNGGVNGSYRLLLNGDGSVRFVIYGDNASQYDFSTTQTINDNQWHHIIASRQGQNGSIYLDGQLAASSVGPIRNLNPSIGVIIGGDTWQNNYYFWGAIDDVRIYSYALAASDASILFDSFDNPLGSIGFPDFADFAQNWGKTDCGLCMGADLNGDSNVDFSDLLIFSDNWFESF
jgi:hypothetical protein